MANARRAGNATANDTPHDRGWMQPQDVRVLLKQATFAMGGVLVIRKRVRRARRREESGGSAACADHARRLKKHLASSTKLYQQLGYALYSHCVSYNKVYRPTPIFASPPVFAPWHELTEQAFMETCRFTKAEFTEVAQKMSLIPWTIKTPTGCSAFKPFALYVMLRRWAGPDTW